MGYRLGVDLGTTFTSAAVFTSGMPTMIGLGNRAMQIPSVLFMKPDGQFLVGEAAERRAAAEPDRVAREFKRRLGDQVPILVAGSPHSPQALQARLLRWVVDQVTQRQGSTPDHITLTHPANWGPYKRDLFDQTIRMADITGADICTEPEAAATLYAARNVLADGQTIAVYDLGGGTFDAAVLRKTTTGFDLLGHPEGIEQLGGIDFDEAVFHHVLATLGDQITTLDDTPDLTAGLARLRRDCVDAKEALSADTTARIPVSLPGLSTSVMLERERFEELIGPTIADTVAAMRRVLTSAHLQPDDLTAIVLTGGSSRIPLVSQQLGTAFNRPLALDTHPKHDVALGAALHGKTLHPATTPPPPAPVVTPPNTPTTTPPATPGPLPPPAAVAPSAAAAEPPVGRIPPTIPPGEGQVPPSPTPRKRRIMVLALAAALILIAGVAAVVITRNSGSSTATTGPASGPTATSSSSPSTVITPPVTPPKLPVSTLLVTSKVGDTTSMYRVDVDSDTIIKIPISSVPEGGAQPRLPTVSPDRTTFIFLAGKAKGALAQPMVTTLAGHPSRLFSRDSPCRKTGRPAFSPDGTELAVICPHKEKGQKSVMGLYVINRDGALRTTLLDDGTARGDPTWTDDGQIIFIRQVGSNPQSLWEMSASGSPDRPRQLSSGSSAESHPDWSTPHGLVFLKTDHGRSDVWVSNAGSSGFHPVTDTGDVLAPSWSPDGERIAFLRTAPDGTFTVETMNADGSDQKAVDWPAAGQPGPPAWGSR